MEKHKRPSWDEYFIEVTRTAAKRATCDRGKNAAVIVKDKRILCTGYVGSPAGIEHCDDVGHEMVEVCGDNGNGKKSMHCIRTSHAEQNAICQAAKFGTSIDGATLYCKMEPCYTCAKMIINSGIKRVVAEKKYHAAERTRDVFKKAGVKLEYLNDEVEKYDNQ
jgi:dCMP deaminase